MRIALNDHIAKLQRRLDRNSRREVNGCLVWTSELTNKGYGRLRLGKFDRKWNGTIDLTAHRASWIIHRGPIPEDMNVLHTCDNRPCFEIAHLFLGTIRDNSLDMVAKGRHPSVVKPESIVRGEDRSNALLTDATVLDMREEYARGGISIDILANKFGVHRSTIWYALIGQNWAHVGGPCAERNRDRKKTSPLIREILRVNYDAGTEMQDLARWFGLHKKTVSAAIRTDRAGM